MNDEKVNWWYPGDPHYDASRAARLQEALLRLIQRDVNFTLDAMVMGLHYPADVNLSVESVEQDEDPDEDEGPSDDWYFKLEGPAFKVTLCAVGPGDVALDDRDISILRPETMFVDEVEGEEAALEWLTEAPMPEARGYL
jgi:hypothetical protein